MKFLGISSEDLENPQMLSVYSFEGAFGCVHIADRCCSRLLESATPNGRMLACLQVWPLFAFVTTVIAMAGVDPHFVGLATDGRIPVLPLPLSLRNLAVMWRMRVYRIQGISQTECPTETAPLGFSDCGSTSVGFWSLHCPIPWLLALGTATSGGRAYIEAGLAAIGILAHHTHVRFIEVSLAHSLSSSGVCTVPYSRHPYRICVFREWFQSCIGSTPGSIWRPTLAAPHGSRASACSAWESFRCYALTTHRALCSTRGGSVFTFSYWVW